MYTLSSITPNPHLISEVKNKICSTALRLNGQRNTLMTSAACGQCKLVSSSTIASLAGGYVLLLFLLGKIH